ncbi:hypothetical protein Hbl1158_09665 [Halobaculum sp. CBA1158]|uniref:hypothetical protein n=1 Tax=Halobaculum sp. CBA1158 TaxID=2904243 RepID=UPI001F27683B|nr:hypothetical protein [Halobaculum sp. CBA1158]UIO98806.1 hypothetical protein Hbl1158_09665 [Halobaculum sp. CBA1158]
MNRLTALPLFGFLTVFGVLYVAGAFEGVPVAERAGGFVLGVLTVLALVAGYSFARGYRGDEDEDEDDPAA